MVDPKKLVNKCYLSDKTTPALCEHQFGKGQLPLTVCKSEVPCEYRRQIELIEYVRYNTDVTNIKTEEEVTA